MRNCSIILFFLSIQFFQAQNGLISNPNWDIKPYFSYAGIIQHRSSLGDLIKGFPKVYELNIAKQTLGDKLWHLENNKPNVGINLSVIDYANPAQLGYGIIVAPFIEIPLSRKERASRLFLRLCWGPAYVTKHFDIVSNQKDGAIGSALNAYIQFKWFWQIKLNKNMSLEPGFMFSHVSNGRAQSPNLGLNIFGVGMALNFRLTDKVKTVSKIDSATHNKSRNEIVVLNSYGINDGEIQGKKQLASCLSIVYNYNKRNTHKFGFGMDFFYEQNYIKDLKSSGIAIKSPLDELRFGPKLSYSYNIGRISLPVEMGVYIYQKTNPDGLFYHKLGIRYFSDNGLVYSFGLRTHWAVAYNFDFGIGYRFRFKK